MVKTTQLQMKQNTKATAKMMSFQLEHKHTNHMKYVHNNKMIILLMKGVSSKDAEWVSTIKLITLQPK